MINSEQLIEFFKTQEIFGSRTSNETLSEAVVYTETYNPFDVKFNCEIEFNNSLKLCVSKKDKRFLVRLGYSNWIGGLAWSDVLLSYIIDEVTSEALINGYLSAKDNIKLSLISKWGSGPLDKVFCEGTLDELKQWGLDNGYEVKGMDNTYPPRYGFYLLKDTEEMRYKNEKILSIQYLFEF